MSILVKPYPSQYPFQECQHCPQQIDEDQEVLDAAYILVTLPKSPVFRVGAQCRVKSTGQKSYKMVYLVHFVPDTDTQEDSRRLHSWLVSSIENEYHSPWLEYQRNLTLIV